MCAVHRTRRRAFEVNSFAVVAAAVAGAFEFVFAGFPIRRASQVRADGRDHEDAFRIADHPDAMRVLEFRVDAKAEVGWIPYRERGFGLEQRARKEEAQEHDEVDAEK